jgi:hypothetical protein
MFFFSFVCSPHGVEVNKFEAFETITVQPVLRLSSGGPEISG